MLYCSEHRLLQRISMQRIIVISTIQRYKNFLYLQINIKIFSKNFTIFSFFIHFSHFLPTPRDRSGTGPGYPKNHNTSYLPIFRRFQTLCIKMVGLFVFRISIDSTHQRIGKSGLFEVWSDAWPTYTRACGASICLWYYHSRWRFYLLLLRLWLLSFPIPGNLELYDCIFLGVHQM